MLAYITKASDMTYREFKEVNSIEDVLKIYDTVIITPSPFKEYPIEKLNNLSIEDRKKLSKAEIEIIIYDDWVE